MRRTWIDGLKRQNIDIYFLNKSTYHSNFLVHTCACTHIYIYIHTHTDPEWAKHGSKLHPKWTNMGHTGSHGSQWGGHIIPLRGCYGPGYQRGILPPTNEISQPHIRHSFFCECVFTYTSRNKSKRPKNPPRSRIRTHVLTKKTLSRGACRDNRRRGNIVFFRVFKLTDDSMTPLQPRR